MGRGWRMSPPDSSSPGPHVPGSNCFAILLYTKFLLLEAPQLPFEDNGRSGVHTEEHQVSQMHKESPPSPSLLRPRSPITSPRQPKCSSWTSAPSEHFAAGLPVCPHPTPRPAAQRSPAMAAPEGDPSPGATAGTNERA